MNDRWLSIKEAAVVVGVSVETVKRYIERDGLEVRLGMVRESKVRAAKKVAAERMRAGRRRGEQAGSRLERIAEAFASMTQLDEDGRRIVSAFVTYAEGRTR